MFLVKWMIIALVLTIIIEMLGAFMLGVRGKKDFINVVLVNIMTNPMVNAITFFVNILFGLRWRRIVLVILEVLAFFVEGLIYRKVLDYKKINGFILSLILNGLSYGLGLIICGIIW